MIDNIETNQTYRKEIDGIRALAVLAVCIYHLNSNVLPSGFLGVDMFFVISGYVITSSLMRDRNKNILSFLACFYERRIRRIFPALIFYIITFSILISFFNPYPGISLWTGITSLLGVSNYFLIQKAGDYFAEPNNLNVFLNTWSLGVEEQFYLFFPLIFWFSGIAKNTKKGVSIFFSLIFCLSIISLITFIFFYTQNISLAYYSMPTRFWEISIGCLIFLSLNTQNRYIHFLKNFPSTICLLAVLILMLIPSTFAGFSHILLVFFTAILLLCLEKNTLGYRVLTKKPLLKIGLLSYSLYLWHWGIISLSHLTIGLHWWSIPFQLLLIYYLSLFSYQFIETPFRKLKSIVKVSQTFLTGLFSLILASLSLVILGKPLKGKLFLGNLQNFLDSQETFYYLDDDTSFCPPEIKKIGYANRLRYAKCFVDNKENARTLFFVGDSHNLSLLAGAEMVAKNLKSNLYFSFGLLFPPLKGNDYMFDSYNEIIKSTKKDDIVFITLRIPFYFLIQPKDDQSADEILKAWINSVEKFAKVLLKKETNLVIATPTPEFPSGELGQCKSQNIQWFNQLGKEYCSKPISYFSSENGIYQSIINKLELLEIENSNIYLFDGLKAMCPKNKCQFSLDKNILYWDSNHISHYGSKNLLAPQIMKFLEDENLL